MDYINKLKNQVSNVLVGNPITKDFEILNISCFCGPGLLWKVYDAKNKSTKQDSSVWMLEKKSLDKLPKGVREDFIAIAKKGVVNLTKLRHPKILSVMHRLEESRESLAFATEPVYASLANIIKPDPNLPKSILEEYKNQKLLDMEIKYGILQLCEALTFLHSDCRQLHLNICPETVIIVRNGSWKLSGFEFSVGSSSLQSGTGSTARDASGELVLNVSEWLNSNHSLVQTNLDYSCPEAVLQGRAVPASDMFSVGMLIYTVFNENKPLLDCHNDVNSYRKSTNELSRIRMSILQCLPENLREYVKLLINYESSLRLDSLQLAKIPYFTDSSVTTLQSMDNLFQLDNLARSHFYKSLPKTVMSMPKRINIHRILPQLTLEFNNNNMVPFVLPTVLQIADLCTELEFSKFVLPKLIPVLNMTEPIQIILIILQNLNIMMSKCPEADFKNYILPMLNRALEVDNQQTQELCLKILPTVSHLMAFSTLKNVIFPRLKKVCFCSTTVQMKVSCLICISKLMEHTDKWFVLDDVLPLLPDIKSREPAVIMAILGIYKMSFHHKKLGITKEILASKAVPFLLPLATDSNLTLGQYSEFITLIQQMIARIDQEHRSKLESINGIQEEYKSIPIDSSSAKNDLQDSLGPKVPAPPQNPLLDEVSKSFGFGNMSGQNLVQYTTSNTNFHQSSDSPTTKKALTTEDKQRLAQQQEHMSQMMGQLKTGNSKPLSANQIPMNKVSTNQSKDLTSTLMEKNLAIMSNTSNQSRPNYNISLNETPSLGNSTFSPMASQTNQIFSNQTRTNQFAAPQMMMQQPPISNSYQTRMNAPSNINTAALDNLCSLPSSASSNSRPMNSMLNSNPTPMGYAQKPLQSSPFPTSQPINPAQNNTNLSSKDIDDLLR